MTRKDFKLIAAAIAKTEAFVHGTSYEEHGEAVLRFLVADFEAVLLTTNERFDSDRFIRAAMPLRMARIEVEERARRAQVA